MASIRREILVSATPDAVWDAIRDVGALHTRLATEISGALEKHFLLTTTSLQSCFAVLEPI